MTEPTEQRLVDLEVLDETPIGVALVTSPTGYCVVQEAPTAGAGTTVDLRIGEVVLVVNDQPAGPDGLDYDAVVAAAKQRPLRLTFVRPRTPDERVKYYGHDDVFDDAQIAWQLDAKNELRRYSTMPKGDRPQRRFSSGLQLPGLAEQAGAPLAFDNVSAAVQHMDSKAPTASKTSMSGSNRPGTVDELNAARGYKPLTVEMFGSTWGIGCGSSGEDLMIIFGCYTVIYFVLLGTYSAFLEAVLASDQTNTALWMFFGIFLFFFCMILFSIKAAGWEKEQQRKQNELNEESEAGAVTL